MEISQLILYLIQSQGKLNMHTFFMLTLLNFDLWICAVDQLPGKSVMQYEAVGPAKLSTPAQKKKEARKKKWN